MSKTKKICTICEKPHKRSTNCCIICDRKRKELASILNKMNLKFEIKHGVSISKIVWLRDKYKVNDIFQLLFNNPCLYFDGSNKINRLEFKRNLRSYHRSSEYKNQKYIKWENEIPIYIFELLKKQTTKKLITISGDKLNPNIHYTCILCNEEHVQKYNDLKLNKSHNCQYLLSRGEAIIADYLKSIYISFKTQFNTLKCINPLTKKQLPYDFELSNKNIIIEVQGEQHVKFIEYFHGTIENFYYQQRKDDYKKRYAESKAYKVIYIYYDEIQNGEYKNIIKREVLDIV